MKNVHKQVAVAIQNTLSGAKSVFLEPLLIENTLFFGMSHYPCSVSVATPIEFLYLLIAGLDAITIYNDNYSKRDLERLKKTDPDLKKWYQLNFSYMYSHELGHFLCAKKYQTLQTGFQISFFVDRDGELRITPSVVLKGYVQIEDYLKIVLSPDEPSEGDWYVYHYYERLLSKK